MAKRPAHLTNRAATPKLRRCAIYTRKSTEEGLDQQFNSLDAQREACAAYIASQRHEGWVLLPDYYDDGGYSGGNMERPGLKQLLAEVKAGRVDIILVYKVDRLTRALSDFARIVDVLDAAGASFVSITQAFNTTTSMGRLTLNVLLSFAQFEREVISERVRDKVAASKRKGMWMGGRVPLGYDAVDRKLVVNDAEAATIRHIMRRYLELGTVRQLVIALEREGLRTKEQTWSNGKVVGGRAFGRGMLYHLLSNRTYRGETVHGDNVYPGEHEAIVPEALWDAVQAQLKGNGVERSSGSMAQEPSLLAGMIADSDGRRLTPSHASKGNRRYRYYISITGEGGQQNRGASPIRIPAGEIEAAVLDGMRDWLANPSALIAQLQHRIERAEQVAALSGAMQRLGASLTDMATSETSTLLRACGLAIMIAASTITASVRLGDVLSVLDIPLASDLLHDDTRIIVPMRSTLARRGQEMRLVIAPEESGVARRDPTLVTMIVTAQDARRRLFEGGAAIDDSDHSRPHLMRMARLAFLAPDITAAILEGTQPLALTARRLLRTPELPIAWDEQRRMFGFK